MKTKILSQLALMTLMVLSIACGKTDNDSNATSTTHQFATLNGGCYDYTSSVYVAPSNCSATNGYYLSNGTCYASATNQIAPVSYCANSTTSSQCYGNYIYSSAGMMQMVTCAGANCRGYTLIDSATGRQVTCQ